MQLILANESPINMKLIYPTENHLVTMMDWFSSEQELANWSGPNFRYPFNLYSFTNYPDEIPLANCVYMVKS